MVPMQRWLNDVSRVSGIPVTRFSAKDRHREVVRLRQAISYIARRKSARSVRGQMSYPEIGRWFGGQDHTTVMHGCEAMENLLRYGEPEALRAYKIAIRAYVKLQQQELARREEVRKAVEKFDAAAEAARECVLLAA